MAVNKYIIQLVVDTGSGEAKVKGVSKAFQDLDRNVDKTTKSVDKYNKTQKGLAGSAGIAGAATAELGRTISDLPYGISAITNNISQLGSMFALLVSSAGGLRNAFSAMIGTMLGPAGILIAFQFVVAAIDYFSRQTKKAEQAVKDFSNEMILQAEVLDKVRASFMDGNKTAEERINLLKTLALTDKNLQNIIEDSTLTEDQRIKKGEEYIDNLKAVEAAERDLMEAKKVIEDDGRTYAEIQDELAAQRAEKAYYELQQATAGANAFVRLGAEMNIQARDREIRKLQEVARAYEIIEQQTLDAAQLREGIQVEARKDDEEEQKALEGSIQHIKDKISALEEQRDNTATTAVEVRRYNEQIRQLEELLKRLESGGVIDKVTNSLKKQGAVIGKALLEGPPQTELQKMAEDNLKDVGKASVNAFQKYVKETASASEITDDEWFLETFGFGKEDFEKKAQMVQQGLNAIADVVGAQLERDLAIEKNKTTALNDQLRERLRNEQLTADARDKINQEIARNEAALVEKQNKIEEKRFKLNKAQGIANAAINTAVAVSKVLPNIPLSIFVGALGAAQIAAIASQKFSPQPSPAPSLTSQSAGGGESQGPAFNLIGAGGQSQLAQAVASQQRAPVKAYVVAGEVTTAQSLERNKVKEASI